MQPEAIVEAREWLDRADLDLRLAERELRIPPPLPSGAAYHAQQAAEKALKAFLAAHNAPFPFTHNLSVLLSLCQALDSTFEQFGDVAASLTPFATQFRYPVGRSSRPSTMPSRDSGMRLDWSPSSARVLLCDACLRRQLSADRSARLAAVDGVPGCEALGVDGVLEPGLGLRAQAPLLGVLIVVTPSR
jgi:HEPN domain-containing protein